MQSARCAPVLQIKASGFRIATTPRRECASELTWPPFSCQVGATSESNTYYTYIWMFKHTHTYIYIYACLGTPELCRNFIASMIEMTCFTALTKPAWPMVDFWVISWMSNVAQFEHATIEMATTCVCWPLKCDTFQVMSSKLVSENSNQNCRLCLSNYWNLWQCETRECTCPGIHHIKLMFAALFQINTQH